MLLTSFHILSTMVLTVCIVCIFTNTLWNKIDSILFPKNNCICGKAAYKSDGKRCLEKKTNRCGHANWAVMKEYSGINSIFEKS